MIEWLPDFFDAIEKVTFGELLKPSRQMSKSLYDTYRGAMAYIEVRLANGDISIGSAFHVGEGVFVTAKHVLKNNTIISLATTEGYYIPDENGYITIKNDPQKYRSVNPKSLTVRSGPYFHPDE